MAQLTYEMFAKRWTGGKRAAEKDLINRFRVKHPQEVGCRWEHNQEGWRLEPVSDDALAAFAGFEERKASGAQQDTTITQEDVISLNEQVAEDEKTAEPKQDEPLFGGAAESTPSSEAEAPPASSEAETAPPLEAPPATVEIQPEVMRSMILRFDATATQTYDLAKLLNKRLGRSVHFSTADEYVQGLWTEINEQPAARTGGNGNGGTGYVTDNGISLSKIAAAPVKTVTTPTAQQTRYIELCTRPGGATAEDLYKLSGTKSTKGVPWKDIVAICAKRFGYVMTIPVDENRRAHYTLTPINKPGDDNRPETDIKGAETEEQLGPQEGEAVTEDDLAATAEADAEDAAEGEGHVA